MQISIEQLIGQQLTAITFIHDYLQLEFTEGFGLTINNRFTWSTTDSGAMIYAKLINIKSIDDRLIFEFSNHETLSINLSKEGFICPEALLLAKDTDKNLMIWRWEDVRVLLAKWAK